MAKPPKNVSTSNTSDTSSTHRRSTSGDNLDRGDHSGARFRTLQQEAEHTSSTDTSIDLPDIVTPRPVIVNDMPRHGITTPESAAQTISWSRDQIDQLFKIEDTGLYMSSEHQLYADTGEPRLWKVESNANGDYQTPLPFAPAQPGPILVKVQNQPLWRIKRQGLPVKGSSVSTSDLGTTVPPLEVVPVNLADKLTRADGNGLRYDKLKRTYVDVVEEGTVMVRKNADGDYQQASSNELTSSGPVFESIEGLTLWQRKTSDTATDDFGPGPSKRPRLDEEDNSTVTAVETGHLAATSNPNPYLWVSWGKTTKPDLVESIQIGQLHYHIVPRGAIADQLPLTFIQHHGFAPSRFEAFERMLHEAPELQPIVTHLIGETRQVKGSIRIFQQTLTQHVADIFKGFTDHTSRAVAKRLFELSSGSVEVNGRGLAVMMQTFRHWEGKSTKSVTGLGDPLDMLPVASRLDGSKQIVPLLPPESVAPLQQLNFNPRLSHTWDSYAQHPNRVGNLELLFTSILNDNGYQVFMPTLKHAFPTLIFSRPNHDKIYFLKLGRVETNAVEINTPAIPVLTSPHWASRVDPQAHQAVIAAEARNNVVWLIGGVQHLPAGEPSAFIFRER